MDVISLTADEARVLGTLVEKAQTTPNQYPLTLNGLVSGVNQKNNRWPIASLDEDRALRAIDQLRKKGLVREVALSGSRVEKFRHVAREALQVDTAELVVLAELLLRGPQTAGELRGRASRMHPLDSLESVEALLAGLAARTPPFVRELPPRPGTRVPRWMQLLAPDLHDPESADGEPEDTARSAASQHAVEPDRLARLEARVAELENSLRELQRSLGVPSRD